MLFLRKNTARRSRQRPLGDLFFGPPTPRAARKTVPTAVSAFSERQQLQPTNSRGLEQAFIRAWLFLGRGAHSLGNSARASTPPRAGSRRSSANPT